MGKLGKKARKFAKKNLQSVLKHRRKFKSMIKRKSSKREGHDPNEDQKENKIEPSEQRNHEDLDILETPLDIILGEDGSNVVENDSDSDGHLSEDCTADDENGTYAEDNIITPLSGQNDDICMELAKNKKKLDRLKKKDPDFSRFLEDYEDGLNRFRDDKSGSEDERDDDPMEVVEEGRSKLSNTRMLTCSTIDALCQQVIGQQPKLSALTSLVNAYRAACRYGTEFTGLPDDISVYKSQDRESFSKILVFMLHEADKIFRSLLGLSCSACKKHIMLDLKNTSKWKSLKPLVKSYLRSTLFLVDQVTNLGLLDFSLIRLRDSILFFTTFPSLLHRLVKVSVQLWATGKGTLSSHSFAIIRDVVSTFGSDWFDTCLIQTYKIFIDHSKFVEPESINNVEFLRKSIIELCSLDLQKSSSKAVVSVQHLAKIMQLALQTKKKEAVKKICSWQYTNCIDLWVAFISENVRDCDLQPLLYTMIQVVNGMTSLFIGPRYLPLRIKCIQWLNDLSRASGTFIPVASFVLDILEYKVGKESTNPGKNLGFSSSVKLPKQWLKSKNFRELCVLSAIELLSTHFNQWSYHISFPELATVPLIRLRKFCETTTIETFRRVVMRFIEQVEQNIEFVRRKRDEVAFSPKDQQLVETFLQLEKSSQNSSFKQHYQSVMQKAVSKGLFTNSKSSLMEKKPSSRKRQQLQKDGKKTMMKKQKT